MLEEILDNYDWQKRISKRGVAFFFFLAKWLIYVNQTVVLKTELPWHELPGYSVLL